MLIQVIYQMEDFRDVLLIGFKFTRPPIQALSAPAILYPLI